MIITRKHSTLTFKNRSEIKKIKKIQSRHKNDIDRDNGLNPKLSGLCFGG